MIMDGKKIALLYFSCKPTVESRRKNWFSLGANRRNEALASSLILQTSQIVQQSGFPVFHYHEGNQTGRTFGERLANAYQEIFDQGYDAVIATGNDTPEMANIDWQTVATQLSAGKCVLGPSLRGGTYLIGLTAAAFCKTAFQNLPWQSGRLFQLLRQYCALAGMAPVVLEALRDINTYHDLIKLVKSASIDRILRRVLHQLVYGIPNVFTGYRTLILNRALMINMPLRAPPATSISLK